MHFCNPPRFVRIGMRRQPVIPHETNVGKQTLQFGIALGHVIMKDSDAVSTTNGLHLRNDATAFIASRHEPAEH